MNAPVKIESGQSARADGLMRHLADFAAGLSLDDVPADVLREAKLEILDTIGCVIAGLAEPDSRAMIACERRALRGPKARLFGTDEQFPVEVAARLNSYIGDVCEHNDLVGSHASIATLPSALAVGDQVGASGADLLRAYIAGTEIVTRLYVAYYAWKKPYTDCGIAPPGIINTIGSAAGCALLMGLDQARILEAAAIGGGLSGWCPVGAVYDEGSTIADAARRLARLDRSAGRALRGGRHDRAREASESNMGLFASLATHYDAQQLTNPGVWHLANPRRKYHSACGYTYAGTDAVKALHDELGAEAMAHAQAIRINVPFYTHRAVAKAEAPRSPTESRFHLPFAAALTAVGEDGVRPEHGRNLDHWLSRTDVRQALAKIEIVVDESFSHYEQCSVDITLADGTVLHREGKAPRGAPANPMTADMVRAKFRANVADVLHPAEAEAYIQTIEALETLPSLDAIYAPFAPAA